jgi:hypothetical protein
LYRSTNVPAVATRSIGAATIVAAVLTMIGAAFLIGGVAGVAGVSALGTGRSIMFFGLGMVGLGCGSLLLVVLRSMR